MADPLNQKTFHRLLREFREAKNMTQTEFGVYLRPEQPLAQATISRLEKGTRFPSRSLMNTIRNLANRDNFIFPLSSLYDSLLPDDD